MSFAPYALIGSIKAAFDREIQDIKDKLAKGHWHGEVAAKLLCGQIAGIERARALVVEEYQKLETLEEDEE